MSLRFEDLWESERCVWHRIESGIPTDLRTSDPQRDDPTTGKNWPKERTVRAQLLIELLTTDRRSSERRPRALHLVGARITGGLDFTGLTLVCPLTLEGCFLGKSVSFDEACAPRVELSSCHVETFTARQLNTRGDLALRRLTATQVSLLGARIGGQLDLSGARLANPDGPALSADGLQVEQDVFCRVSNSEGCISRFHAKGEVSLHGARIGGQLDFSGAKLDANLDWPALSAGGLQVDQSMFCAQFDAQHRVPGATGVPRRRTPRRPRTALLSGEQFMASGEVNLLGARIGGQLDFSGAKLANPDGPALSADRLQVDQDMFCREQFTASGEVSLLGAHIGGQLDFSSARLVANLDRPALSADGLQVDQGMLCGTWGSKDRPRRFYGAPWMIVGDSGLLSGRRFVA